MTYKIVDEYPKGRHRRNDLELLEDQPSQTTQPACPPSTLDFHPRSPHLLFFCQVRYKDLCKIILKANQFAVAAASRLESKPLDPKTVRKFKEIFREDPGDLWELAWKPRQKKPAGAIVAKRFRIVADALRTRKTAYWCTHLCNQGPGGLFPEEPDHPTNTVVRDPVAWAGLCEDKVWLCEKFWSQPKEEQAGTIIHEMLHLCFEVTCAWFQHDSKELKRNSTYCKETARIAMRLLPYLSPGILILLVTTFS
jgi:hypothetical protein